MPKIGLTTDNKAQSAFDYPKIFLDKGERARLVCLEADPLFEYVHTLREPVLENGAPVMETVKKFGKEVTEPKMAFVGRHICIGDYATISEKGVDTKGCPVCKASTETDAVKAPERRFAMHVVRYATKAGSFEVQNPFSVSIAAWTFGNKIFDTLVDFATEWGDLKRHDLLLGPCEVKQFQKFDIQVAAKAAWLESEATKTLTATTYKENQCKDLGALIGRKLSSDQVEDDLDRVLRAYRQAFGRGAGADAAPSSSEVAAALELDGLLGDETASNKPKAANLAAGETGLDDVLNGEEKKPGDEGTSQPGPQEPDGESQTESQPGPPKDAEEFDLDDLLADV